MGAAEKIIETIEILRTGESDLFYSHKIVDNEPSQFFTGWHLHEVNTLNFLQHKHITRLYLQDCNRVQSLSWLDNFPNLETLWIYGSDKLSNINSIGAIKKLKSLTIWPSFSANITLNSLAPLATLDDLEELNFSGKTRDNSLSHLAPLKQLTTVFFSNSYPWKEIAGFEADHPEVEFPWKGGVVYDANPTILKCKKCAAPQAMLSGKGLKLSCPHCDAVYIKKHVERYTAVSAA